MNIQLKATKSFNEPRPTNFVEATIQMAKCYEGALEAGVKGTDDDIRFWVDKSRTVKSFFKKYQESKKTDLLEDLEMTNSKQVLVESLSVLKCAEPFVLQWVNRFTELSISEFNDFHDFHWDIFVDFIVPLTWDWAGDVFVIQHENIALINRLIDRGQVRMVIIESDEKKRDILRDEFSDVENGDHIHLIKSKDEISKIISTWVDNPPYLSRVISSDIFLHDLEKKEELHAIQELVREGMVNALTFDNTIKSHDMVWIKNGLGNFVDLLNHPHVANLRGKFEDFSAIIVSPGPSLEKNIKELKRVKGSSIIIAVSHSLEYLSAHKIVPDIVLHVDPNVNIQKYFENFDMEKVELLILSATTAPKLFDLPSKHKAWIYANAYFDNWLMEINNIEDYTLYGSCVSVAALKMAYTWGCKSIALVGQDLSFGDKKYYAGDSFAPEHVIEAFEESSKAKFYKLPGYYGGKVVTKNDYRVYHGQFEQLAEDIKEYSDIELYNCTEGGANIEGFENITLSKFVAKELKVSKNFTCDLSPSEIIASLDQVIELPKVRNNIIKTIRLINTIEKLMNSALKKTESAMNHPSNELLIHGIQKKIASKIKTSMFLKMALQDALSDLAESEKYENNRHGYIKKSNEMYKACLDVLRELKGKISKIKC